MINPWRRFRDTVATLLQQRSNEFYVVALLLWLLPALALTVLGLMYLWQTGWFWWFSGGLLVLTLISWVARRTMSRSAKEAIARAPHLDPRPDWSAHDHRIWQQAIARIADAELIQTPWETIPQAALDHLFFVASAYHGDDPDARYAFTLPELLLMLETWSREYRAQVVQTVPLARRLKISRLLHLSRSTGKLRNAYRYAGPLVRTLRLAVNPVTGIAREAASQVAMSMFSELNEHMQNNLKVTLFEQVTHVAIDLYSGRLKLSAPELASYRDSLAQPVAVELKPLSVLVVGQVNAGKSSLVNALKQQCVAEIDTLPSTEGFDCHHLQLDNALELYLIDSPGLDGSERANRNLLEEAARADLLLWVSQANQPAKELDRQLMEHWQAFFVQHLRRKKPPLLLVTTHNDQLRPRADWQPPYDLEDTDNPRVAAMLDALRYAHETIGFAADDPAVPVALPPGGANFNLEVLRELLQTLSDQARAAQLNRQRLDAADSASSLSRILQQTAGLVRFGKTLALKKPATAKRRPEQEPPSDVPE